jgi:hypothetical protein
LQTQLWIILPPIHLQFLNPGKKYHCRFYLSYFHYCYHINKAYKNYYHKQKRKLIEENNLLLEIKELENEQQLMRIRNEQLSQDVDSKAES